MNLYDVTKEILEEKLELPKGSVPEEFVIVAKHLVMGISQEQVADTMGVEGQVIQSVMEDPLFKEIKGFIGAVYAQEHVSQSAGWDALENMALQKLVDRVKAQRGGDPEFLLRVAAVANKAQRRTQQQDNVLDAQRVGYTTITLTSRLVKKLNQRTGEATQIEEKALSIKDGSMSVVGFDDVNKLLNVRSQPMPYLDPSQQVKISTHEPTPEEIVDNLLRDSRRA
jgi:hypothetical protein